MIAVLVVVGALMLVPIAAARADITDLAGEAGLQPAPAASSEEAAPAPQAAPEPKPEAEAEPAPVETEAPASEAEAGGGEEAAPEAGAASKSSAPPADSAPEAADPAGVRRVASATGPVAATGDLVEETGARVASSAGAVAEDVVGTPPPADAVPEPADLVAEMKRTIAVLGDPLRTLPQAAGPQAASLLEIVGETSEVPSGGAGAAVRPTATDNTSAGISAPLEGDGPRALIAPPVPDSLSFPLGGAPGSGRVLPSAFTFPDHPVLPGPDDNRSAPTAASVGAPAGPIPHRSPSGPPGFGVGSGSGGSIFLPLLALLALLALAVPRGYRRRMAVGDFPVPTPFVCALERPG